MVATSLKPSHTLRFHPQQFFHTSGKLQHKGLQGVPEKSGVAGTVP